MITEAEKEIKGLVEIELNSGKQYIKFTNRANQVIWEKTGKTMLFRISFNLNSAVNSSTGIHQGEYLRP